jgi:hypothetical protein
VTKRTTWISIAVALIAVLGAFVWFGASRAMESRREPDDGPVLVSEDVAGDLMASGGDVEMRAEVRGDAALAGAKVVVARPVRGYLMAAGSSVTVDAVVENDLWAAGSDVRVRARIGDSVRIAGASVVLGNQATIGGDALIAAGQVDVRAPVGRNLTIHAREATVSSSVGGSLEVHADTLSLLPGAVIEGDLIVHGASSPDIAREARIAGSIEIERDQGSWWERSPVLTWLGTFSFALLALLALGVPTLAFSGSWPERTRRALARGPGRSAIRGAGGLVLVPIAAALFAMTVFGAPLAIALIALYVAAILLAAVLVSYALGTWILERLNRSQVSPYGRFAVGATGIAVLVSLPLVGWIAQLAVVVLGLGALLFERAQALRGARSHLA